MQEEPRFGLPRTLVSYVTREVISYSLLGFLAILVVLVSQNLLRRLDEFVGVGFTWADFRIAVGGTAVMFISYAAPVSFLFGALLAMRRMAADNEILAMRACGIGISALLLPTLAVGALVSGITGFLMIHAEHQARRDLRTLLITVAARGNILQPGSFRTIGGRVVYIRERDGHNNLRGIMISAQGGEDRPYVIFAEKGRFDFDPERAMARIRLERGEVHLEPDSEDPEPYQRLSFENLSYEIDIRGLVASGYNPTRPKQMTLAELREVGALARAGKPLHHLDDRNPINYELEIHRRLALPLAPILFAVLAVALGASQALRSRAWVLLVGLLLAFSYYVLISFGALLAEKTWIQPALAPWGPTLLFAVLAVAALLRARGGVAR